jgi:hypothetical protein
VKYVQKSLNPEKAAIKNFQSKFLAYEPNFRLYRMKRYVGFTIQLAQKYVIGKSIEIFLPCESQVVQSLERNRSFL